MLTQLRQNPSKDGNLFCSFHVGLKLTGPDHFLHAMIDVYHLAGQRDQQKSERQYDDNEHQQGHDEGREDFPFFKDVLEFLKDGIKDHRQEDGPYDR